MQLLYRLRAMSRVIGTLFALAFYLGRLVILSSLFGFREQRGFKFRRKFTRAAMRILGVQMTMKGEPHAGTALYVSNHRSLVDPLAELNQIDAYVVSKAEVANYPLVGRGARETGVIFVKRQESSSRQAAREAIRSALVSGKSILIYPEGTTSDVATSQPFKIGSFQIAADEDIPVVPVAIDYENPADYWFNRPMMSFFMQKFGKRTTRVKFHIGPPISSGSGIERMLAAKGWIDDEIMHMRSSDERIPMPH